VPCWGCTISCDRRYAYLHRLSDRFRPQSSNVSLALTRRWAITYVTHILVHKYRLLSHHIPIYVIEIRYWLYADDERKLTQLVCSTEYSLSDSLAFVTKPGCTSHTWQVRCMFFLIGLSHRFGVAWKYLKRAASNFYFFVLTSKMFHLLQSFMIVFIYWSAQRPDSQQPRWRMQLMWMHLHLWHVYVMLRTAQVDYAQNE
jgi:hypothetical protein